MKKNILLFSLLLLSAITKAQNVGIGTNAPAASAKLDITSTNSGVLIPRVALTMTTAAGPVAAPANSLLVYNTATAGDVTPGFYYWSSTSSAWIRLAEGTGWLTTGNLGIGASNFLGPINAADLNFRTSNTQRAVITAAGNMGINVAAPDASAQLDVTATNRGVLIPRVALTATNAAGPVAAPATSLLVYNTATAGTGTATAVTPGFYYWSGAAWVRITENGWKVGTSTATTNAIGAAGSIGYLGTSSNSHVDLVSNNIVRGRLSNLGEFFIGTTNTVLAGDLMNGVSNVTFPWAVNGYSAFNGAGTYGQITGGATLYAGVQGEYYGTNPQGAGVRGLIGNTTAGTGFNTSVNGVSGSGSIAAASAGSYKFGVYGSGGFSLRSGGVLGYDFGICGGLGYFSSGGLDYSVYGFGVAFTTGVAAGKPTVNTPNAALGHLRNSQISEPNNHIGLGIYGGVMGGWVRGLQYGFNVKGETYSMYVDGKSYTTQPLAYLMPTATDERVPGYMASTMNAEISCKGKTTMEKGSVYVAFDDKFKKVMTNNANDLIIVVTPHGNTQGVFVHQVTTEGFWIAENNNGQSTVQVSWVATSPATGADTNVAPELLDYQFDVKMNGVMFNDYNTQETPQSIWWDGTQMRWDTPPSTLSKKPEWATENAARDAKK